MKEHGGIAAIPMLVTLTIVATLSVCTMVGTNMLNYIEGLHQTIHSLRIETHTLSQKRNSLTAAILNCTEGHSQRVYITKLDFVDVECKPIYPKRK